jgi:hypothetical protein
VIRVLAQLDLNHLRKEWDRLYGVRSGIFHGTTRLADAELNAAANDTITLCGQIVFALIANGGGAVPSTIKSRFLK